MSYNLYDLALPDDTKALSSSGDIGIEEFLPGTSGWYTNCDDLIRLEIWL